MEASFSSPEVAMRIIPFSILALFAACKQYGPTIIEDKIAAEAEQNAGDISETEQAPAGMGDMPALPPVPLLDDGTPLHAPHLPPGMKPDPNSNDLVSIFRRNCQTCHGEFGAGNGKGAPNFIESPQPLNNAIDPMIDKVLKGHGNAPAIGNKLKRRTVFHLIEYLRGRVGMMRGMKAFQQSNQQNPAGTDSPTKTQSP
jgi:hypothetical protein